MPLHDVGYRSWQGRRQGPWSAAMAIATTGIRLAWTSRWLRRAVFFAWSPALFFAASFFAFEQAIDEGRIASLQDRAARGRNLDGIGLLGTILADTLGASDAANPQLDDEAKVAATRRLVWSRLLLAFMRAPQAVLLAVVVGLVAPALISRDLRAKAWLVYFTRPLGGIHYIVGKIAVLASIVAAVTVLPAVALWFAGVLVSPSAWVVVETWDLPLKIIAASIALAIPTVLLALAYSSLTAESRIASFAWFATWAACWVAHSSLVTADFVAAIDTHAAAVADGAEEDDGEWRPPPKRVNWVARAAGVDTTIDRWSWISPYHAVGVIQAWIFGVESRPQAVLPPAIALAVVSVASILVLAWRVAAPMRA
jgi:ABC-2 type transport system permease protein